MTVHPCDPFAATRLARIDPGSGAEIGAAAEDRDATVIGAPLAAGEAPRRRTAEFVPAVGMRATGEVTAAWRGEPPAAALPTRLRGLVAALRRGPQRRRTLLLGALLLAAGAAAALAWRDRPAAALARGPAPAVAEPPAPAAAIPDPPPPGRRNDRPRRPDPPA